LKPLQEAEIEKQSSYHGEVLPYYPPQFPQTPADQLYVWTFLENRTQFDFPENKGVITRSNYTGSISTPISEFDPTVSGRAPRLGSTARC
jgi:hypothetical protein